MAQVLGPLGRLTELVLVKRAEEEEATEENGERRTYLVRFERGPRWKLSVSQSAEGKLTSFQFAPQ
jgi:hypothetical protein